MKSNTLYIDFKNKTLGLFWGGDVNNSSLGLYLLDGKLGKQKIKMEKRKKGRKLLIFLFPPRTFLSNEVKLEDLYMDS